MQASQIYKGLRDATITAEELASQASADLVNVLVEGMGEGKPEIKYGCMKALRLITDEQPEVLYAYWDTFAEMLDHPNNLFQWQGLYVLAGLSGVDEEGKMAGLLDDYFARVDGPLMITAANAIKGGALIAKGQPDLADRVGAHILRAEDGEYEEPECYEIVCGTALKTFYKMRKWVSDPEELYRFAERHKNSSRPATRKQAEKFIARYEKEMEKV